MRSDWVKVDIRTFRRQCGGGTWYVTFYGFRWHAELRTFSGKVIKLGHKQVDSGHVRRDNAYRDCARYERKHNAR